MAQNPVLRWSRPANSPTITGFRIQWTRNGSNVGTPVAVPVSAAADTAGYSSTYSAGAGSPVTGDVIGAGIVPLLLITLHPLPLITLHPLPPAVPLLLITLHPLPPFRGVRRRRTRGPFGAYLVESRKRPWHNASDFPS
jgi:hypothetical protein